MCLSVCECVGGGGGNKKVNLNRCVVVYVWGCVFSLITYFRLFPCIIVNSKEICFFLNSNMAFYSCEIRNIVYSVNEINKFMKISFVKKETT